MRCKSASLKPIPSWRASAGSLPRAEAKMLILKKLYDLANEELTRYLNAEKRRLIQAVESSRTLEFQRAQHPVGHGP